MSDLTVTQLNALNRLFESALYSKSAQAEKVANFLLGWWNPETFGIFDMRDAWCCDGKTAEDIVKVFGFAARNNNFPDVVAFEELMEAVVSRWRRPASQCVDAGELALVA